MIALGSSKEWPKIVILSCLLSHTHSGHKIVISSGLLPYTHFGQPKYKYKENETIIIITILN